MEECVEERLLIGLHSGSLLHHKDLLDMLEDVDVRGMRQRTLLHVGVRLGKADWVEELLARGADTDLKDDSQLNALSSAEEMVRRFPEEMDRSLILKLVTLVHRRDQAMMHRLEPSSSRSNDHITPVARNNQDIESLKSSVDALRQEMKSLMCQLISSLEELKTQVCGRDTLLRCLEEAVTSTVEDVTSIRFELGGEAAISPAQLDPVAARQECVDAMLRKTTFVFGNGVDEMRRVYERMYDLDDCTACIIKYLCWDDRVKVMVDCGSNRIGRMKERFVQLDGTQGNGSEIYSFCDFESDIVYLGAKSDERSVCAFLAWALFQLALKFVFGNEGRPYSKGDVEREREWMRVVEEAEEMIRKRGWVLYWWIDDALDMGTELARVCHLAAAVPWIIAKNGSKEGRDELQKFFPLLFSMYSNHVMPTLLAKARR
ncbi:uncharacterized protein LOC124170135 isoform X2 [Ischnura elegans]|uniref:uncharacterized protein LOC124170135 isoform X1 n=1 Tax=Ischnura elegans TaxID=197161 RepID=UPI001ED88AB1|nr:uncharacterized protein LOC124170135 isoform X1 [Ischnura elegans]XP_046404786.1 uncharacterized protein LOC124170135 isoform X2 [Ischnura elegans]